MPDIRRLNLLRLAQLMNINPKSKVVEIKSCDSIFRPVIDGATKANVQEEIASEINQWVETL